MRTMFCVVMLATFIAAMVMSCVPRVNPAPTEDIRATQTAYMATRTATNTGINTPGPTAKPIANADRPYAANDPYLWAAYDRGEGYISCKRDWEDLVDGDHVCYLINRTPFDNATPTAKAAARSPQTITLSRDVTVRGATFLCYDVSATYRTFHEVGHQEALDHLQNFMNLETGGNPYIRPSDARTAWEDCR